MAHQLEAEQHRSADAKSDPFVTRATPETSWWFGSNKLDDS